MPPVTTKRVVKAAAKPAKENRSGVLGRIQPLEVTGGIKINLYGRSSTGKTTFWATFPKPILAIIVSGGKNPGELRSINTPEYRQSIRQVKLEKSTELKELIDYQAEERNYKTIVLDHATGLQDMVLREILGIEELPAQMGWGVASQQQWGQCALQMKELLRGLLNLDDNVVITAQEREFNTDSESEIVMPYVGSALSPSVTGWLNPACDYIVQTFIREKMETKTTKLGGKEVKTTVKVPGEVEYCMRTGPDPVFTTKFRVPRGTVKLPPVIVDPTYDKVYKLISGVHKV